MLVNWSRGLYGKWAGGGIDRPMAYWRATGSKGTEGVVDIAAGVLVVGVNLKSYLQTPGAV